MISAFGNEKYLKDKICKLKGVVFDCDGVLIDSRDSNIRYYNFVKEKLGLPLMNEDEIEYVHTHTVYESIKYIVPEDRLEEALEVVKNIPYNEILKLIKLENGVMEFLELLKKLNIKCAVNTNRTTTMDAIMDKFGLKGYFFPVVTANIIKHPKPHPESIRFILNTWGFKPEEVVYIGDSKVDEETAKNGNIDFWSYKNFDLNANLYIPDYRTLCEWFLKFRS